MSETPNDLQTSPENAAEKKSGFSAGKFIYWLITLAGLAVIGWKFFGAQEDPMEEKMLIVFAVFLLGAGAYRLIKSKTQDFSLKEFCDAAIEWTDTGVSAVLLAFLIMSFLLQAFKIPSGSMLPTLQIGDHLFVNKFIYGTQMPFTLKRLWHLKAVKRGDVVVFLCPPQALSEEERKKNIKKDFIKRAIGLPGDTIEIKDKTLYVNGQPADDPHRSLTHPATYPKPNFWPTPEAYQKNWSEGEFVYLPIEAVRDNFGPVVVPPEHYFVMGDNRDGSFDSRFWGPLPEKYLKGKALLIYWPFTRMGGIR